MDNPAFCQTPHQVTGFGGYTVQAYRLVGSWFSFCVLIIS